MILRVDARFAMAQDKKRAGHFAGRLTCPTSAHGSGAPFRSTERKSSDNAQEFEFRARLEKQREAQKALESELLAKMETL